MTTKKATWLDGLETESEPNPIRKKKADHDWLALHALAVTADSPLSEEEMELWRRGLLDGNARMWNVEYTHAAQAALEQRESEQLLAMMDAAIPLPSFLLPVIADVVRTVTTGKPGRAPLLTRLAHENIRSIYERLITFEGPEVDGNEAHRRAIRYLSKVKGISAKTVERSLKLTAQP